MTEVVAENVEFPIGGGKKSDGKSKTKNKPVDDDPFENNPDTIDISDDDLPF